jgi:DNA-binding NarL/FixJ family response regulator
MKYTVSIVDGDAASRRELASAIKSSSMLALDKVYDSAEDAMTMSENPPDTAIIGMNLPGISGTELIRYLKDRTDIECLVSSALDNDDTILHALENGASGYIIRDSAADDVQSAVLEVMNGGARMSPYIARRVLSHFRKPKMTVQGSLLSNREYMVMQLLSEGLTYRQIAQKLYISRETVKKHMHNIYQKLHVQNSVQAVNKMRML